MVVKHYNLESAEFMLPVQDLAPGIFTTSQDGNGQGAILQTAKGNNLQISFNSKDNPVEKGAAIIVYATGAGLWNQDVLAGQILLSPAGPLPIIPKAAISLTIGGVPAFILYAGGAPAMASVIQVNALVPANAGSGDQILELKVGDVTNAQQRVTVAVQ